MASLPSWPEEGPRRSLLTEARFAQALYKEGFEFVQELQFLRSIGTDGWMERRLYALYRKSTDIETFLDDHGAPANQTFFMTRELIAGARWLSLACSCLVHLRSRLKAYPQANLEWAQARLPDHLQVAIDCFGSYLVKCAEGISEEWVRLGLPWPENAQSSVASHAAPKLILPANRLPEADERAEAGQQASLPAARLVGRVLRLLNIWAPLRGVGTGTHEERQSFMENFCSEATARDFESRVHNLQSEYDSNIRGSAEEKEHADLLRLRGGISQCLHLLEAVTALTHLYERHQVHQRHPATRRVLARIVDWEEYLRITIECCILPAFFSLSHAEDVVAGLLKILTVQSFRDFEIPDGVSLHARPLSLIVGIVHHFGLPVEIEIHGKRASAASMMSMLILCGSHLDAKSVRFHGDAAVLTDLEDLFEARLGEDGLEAFPPRLKYLIR
jgi:phosphotransferase system HPr-like phosphotransfer protein